MDIFQKRVALMPREYPEALDFVKAIRHSYWVHDEWGDVPADVQDFKVSLNDQERNVVKNALLAISQIEVSVKTFWGKLHDHLPKPEFNSVGATFAESEVRHEEAYSHLLKVLGLQKEFENLLSVPAINGRIEYLTKYLENSKSTDHRKYAVTLALFSLFVENVSLFSQFLIVKSFNFHKNVLKDIDNIIQATQKEETLHALFGVYVIKQIQQEHPEWFDDDLKRMFTGACIKAFNAEVEIINWIFEKGELSFIDKATVINFMAHRFNESMEMIDLEPVFVVDQAELSKLDWFFTELYGETQVDQFNKKSTAYSKFMKSVKRQDIFG